MKPIFFSEIEPYPCAVLKYHYPQVPNLGDMTKIRVEENGQGNVITNGTRTISLPGDVSGQYGLDILFGGTPCQDFSTAGLRKGAGGDEGEFGSGSRSSLCFHFVRLLREIRPRFFVYENVVGMLSSNEGRDFAHFLVALGEVGYTDIAWRVLDAQYVRVDGYERAIPQRRRRVWVVGCAGSDHGEAEKILLEPYCLRGNNPPKRKTWQEIARGTIGCTQIHDRTGCSHGCRVNINYNKNSSYIFKDFKENISTTILARDRLDFGDLFVGKSTVQSYENHPNDSRVKKIDNICQAITSRCGTGGGNVPLLSIRNVTTYENNAHETRTEQTSLDGTNCSPTLTSEMSITFGKYNFGCICKKVERNEVKSMVVRCGNPVGGGKGALIADNISQTLQCVNSQTIFVPQCEKGN